MSFNQDISEGMGSVFDIGGKRHFNGFDNYQGPTEAFRNAWHNVGIYINDGGHKAAAHEVKNPFSVKHSSKFYKF